MQAAVAGGAGVSGREIAVDHPADLSPAGPHHPEPCVLQLPGAGAAKRIGPLPGADRAALGVGRNQTGPESAADRDHRGIRQALCHPQPVPGGLREGFPGRRGGAAADHPGTMNPTRNPDGSAKTPCQSCSVP